MRDYEDINKISIGREKQRAYYIPYDSLEKALAGDKFKSEYYKLLNGKWLFNYYKNEDEIPKEIKNGIKLMYLQHGRQPDMKSLAIPISITLIPLPLLMFLTITLWGFMKEGLS